MVTCLLELLVEISKSEGSAVHILFQIICKNVKIDFASFIRETDYSFLPFVYSLSLCPIYDCKTLLVTCLNMILGDCRRKSRD